MNRRVDGESATRSPFGGSSRATRLSPTTRAPRWERFACRPWRYTVTRREAAASLGISINHVERKVQPELKVLLSGQLILIPVAELERWV